MDELLYGFPVRVLRGGADWTFLLTHYGYAGTARTEELRPMTEDALRDWTGAAHTVDAPFLDVLERDSVRGKRLAALPRGALLRVIDEARDGWTRVRLAGGREGFAASRHLAAKRFGEEYLDADPAETLETLRRAAARDPASLCGGRADFSFPALLERWYGGREEAFRRALTAEAARYRGVQYRWGGRSPAGIDCSGLLSQAYMRCGVNIYRDASLARGWPLVRLPLAREADGRFSLSNLDSGALRPGDALYFPGHVAMYWGDGRYLHATGRAGDCAVVMNSLRPDAPDFRADLRDGLYAAGGLR